MSEIDIERKESGGIPWWAWLLGLLLLAGLAFAILSSLGNKDKVAAVGVDNGAMVADTDTNMTDANMADANVADANMAPAMGTEVDKSMSNSAEGNGTVATGADAEEISNILSVVDAKDPAALYNKKVKLVGAPVQAAGTDHFWVGPSFEQKMLVVTDSATDMNGIATGVAQRDRVDIEGTIMEVTDFDDAKTKYKLDDSAVTFLTNKKMILMATSVMRDKN